MPSSTTRDSNDEVNKPNFAKLIEPQIARQIDRGVKEYRLKNLVEKDIDGAYLRLDCNPSRMKAFLSYNGKISLTDVLSALLEKGIKVGVQTAKIKKQLELRKSSALFPCAIGTDVVEGREESINLVKRDFLGKEKFDEIDVVYQDDVIAEVTPEVAGIPGKDIFGFSKDPIKVQESMLKTDHTILKLTDEGQVKLVAQENGYLERTKESLRIVPELVVRQEFKSTMGNIYFNNNIKFEKELEGAYIESEKNITVEDVVTSASLRCHDLTLLCGINGQKKSLIEVYDDMRSNYVSESHLVVKNELTVNKYIYWSEVSAKTIVGPDMKIVGGTTISYDSLEIGSVGSDTMSGRATIVVGMNYEDFKVNMVLRKQLDIYTEQADDMKAKIRESKGDRKNNLMKNLAQLQSMMDEVNGQIEKLEATIEPRNERAQIILKKGIKGKVLFIIAGVEKELILEETTPIGLKLTASKDNIEVFNP